MAETHPIIIPLVNPNEPEALLAALQVTSGQLVHKGDSICTLETTKSTLDLMAEYDGYVVGLASQIGQIVQAGEVLGYLTDDPEWVPPRASPVETLTPVQAPAGMRISQPALQLAQQHHLDLTSLPGDVFITEKMVQELVDTSIKAKAVLQSEYYEANSIIVYGGGGHGKSLIDLIRTVGIYPIAGIVDDGIAVGTDIMGVTVLGGADILAQLYECGVRLAANAVGGIGNINTRIKVFDRLRQVGFSCPTLVHPTAFVENSATLADGIQVFPHTYVGSEAQVGFGVIINTGAIVSHDCVIGDYSNLSPGAILAGEVSVGAATLVGMGVTINLQVKIGSRARLGNGATVKQDVPEYGIVRAGTIWPE